MREALGEAITDMGHDVRLADSGITALAAFERQTIHAALIDLRMPGMDGLELLARIREQPSAPPIAVLTAHATAHDTIEAMRLGAFDHLTKPIGREDLSRVLTTMLGAGAERRSAEVPAAESELIGSSESLRAVQKAIGGTRSKRGLVAGGVVALALGALLVAALPDICPVMIAQVLIGASSSIFIPAICAISLGVVGHHLFDRRQGRNQTFNSAGNVVAAESMGLLSYFISDRAIFFLSWS